MSKQRIRTATIARVMTAATVATLSVLAATGTSASALKNCPNNIGYKGERIARICIETQASASQPDLVTLESLNSHYGVSKKMSLKVCTYRGGSPNTCATDTGTYKYLAGPIPKFACRRFTVQIWEPGDSSHRLTNATITETCN